MASKPRKPFDGIGRPKNYTLDDIYGSDTESKRMANRVLDQRKIPNDYKSQYIAEADMRGRSQKFLKNKNKRVKKYVK